MPSQRLSHPRGSSEISEHHAPLGLTHIPRAQSPGTRPDGEQCYRGRPVGGTEIAALIKRLVINTETMDGFPLNLVRITCRFILVNKANLVHDFP